MSTPKTEAGKPQLSDREMEILSKAWKCMKVQPEVSLSPIPCSSLRKKPH